MWMLIIQSPNEIRREYAFKSGVLTIGREADNTIVINERYASRYHAEIFYNQEQTALFIRDLESTNGTFVNGKQISETRQLEFEDQIRIGQNLITVTLLSTRELAYDQPKTSDDTLSEQNLLFESIESYAVLIHELEKKLSNIPDLETSLVEASNFISRSINADISHIVLRADFNKVGKFGIPEALAPQIIGGGSPKLIASSPIPGRGDHSVIIVPVRINMDIGAVIYAFRNRITGQSAFDVHDLQLVVAAGHQLALLIQHKQHEEALVQHANHDPLTGLPNRNLLLDRIQRSIEKGKKDPPYEFALFFIDINEFKLVNDSLGHPVGDELLILIGKRLKKFFGRRDTIARFGGDEFAILYEHRRVPSAVSDVAERLLDRLSRPFKLGDKEIHITASVGITASSMEYQLAQEMLRDADIAMYRAKEMFDGGYEIYDAVMHEQLIERMSLQAELRNAIEKNEFELYYQPIVSLKDGKIIGLEALVRWDSPTRGFLKPGEFLNISETTGLLRSIDDWVLQTACEQAAKWQQQILLDQPIYVSVNLSDKQIGNPKLVEKIDKILTDSGLPPDLLWLEITENTVLGNEEAAIATMKELQALGVHFSLDDFGTGYSTFSYLYRLPFDILKIDRAFIMEIDRNLETKNIVQMLIDLARHLGLRVIAEGIEKEEHFKLLRDLNCEFGQGYYFARPLVPERVGELLSSDHRWG